MPTLTASSSPSSLLHLLPRPISLYAAVALPANPVFLSLGLRPLVAASPTLHASALAGAASKNSFRRQGQRQSLFAMAKPAPSFSPSAAAAGAARAAGAGAAAASAAATPVQVHEPEFAAKFPEVPSLADLAAMAGPPAVIDRLAHAKERRMETAEATKLPELLLYRDNSSWCPYCERVLLQLEEKHIPYRIEKINMRCYGPKPDWFLKMVPSGLLPVIKLNGRVVTESLDIMLLIEEAYPGNTPLLPPDAESRRRVQDLLRLERQLMGAWLQWGHSPPRSERREAFWPGADPQDKFEEVLLKVDTAIAEGGGPLFLGEKFSFVDAVYAPFIERVAASIPYWKGLQVRGNPKWPNINKWIDAMDARPAYKAIKSDDFTIAHTLEPQIGEVIKTAEGAAHRAKIDGKDGSWDLPLKPESTAWGFDDGSGASGAREEAAQALLTNHEAVVAFAMRSLKASPLDAPAAAAQVSAGFRHVAHALLRGFDEVGPLPTGLEAGTVAVAAAYFRDRVGVPRDLTYPAARQLRAHLQWLVRSLGADL